MKLCLLILLSCCLLAVGAGAQSGTDTATAAIDKDIWIPFVEGVNKGIDALYIDVHARDFYWVASGSRGRIMDFKEYELDSKMVMEKRRKESVTSEVDVRFLERNVKGNFASEKCVFRFTLQEKGKAPQTSYGLSQVFSRKEGGTWKMYLQYKYPPQEDAKELFDAAAPLRR